MQRELLYYEGLGYVPKEHFGYIIIRFKFKNVKTGEDIALNVCQNTPTKKVHTLGKKFYDSVENMISHNDILWHVKNDRISPIEESFETISNEYSKLMAEGFSEEDIYNYLKGEYCKKGKTIF